MRAESLFTGPCLGGQSVHVRVYLCVCVPVYMPLYVHACRRDLYLRACGVPVSVRLSDYAVRDHVIRDYIMRDYVRVQMRA